jgi:hypothetical protein
MLRERDTVHVVLFLICHSQMYRAICGINFYEFHEASRLRGVYATSFWLKRWPIPHQCIYIFFSFLHRFCQFFQDIRTVNAQLLQRSHEIAFTRRSEMHNLLSLLQTELSQQHRSPYAGSVYAAPNSYAQAPPPPSPPPAATTVTGYAATDSYGQQHYYGHAAGYSGPSVSNTVFSQPQPWSPHEPVRYGGQQAPPLVSATYNPNPYAAMRPPNPPNYPPTRRQ